MTKSEFQEKWECGYIYFDEVISMAHDNGFEWSYDIYDRDSMEERIANNLWNIFGDFGWRDMCYYLCRWEEDYDNGFDYYDYSETWGEMGFSSDDDVAYDLVDRFIEDMDRYGLWDPEEECQTITPDEASEIVVEEFIFV